MTKLVARSLTVAALFWLAPVEGQTIRAYKFSNLCGDGLCEAQAAEDFGTCSRDCRSLDNRTDYLRELLERARGEVDEGKFSIFEAAQCADVPVCFNNNPTSPYGRFMFPLAPGEPDPDPADIRENPGEDVYAGYRLKPSEALLWIGRTPPEIPYFSFTTYVFSRFDPDSRGNPPYRDRATIFASLGDAENQLTLKTAAGPGETAFDQECVLIATADRNTDRWLRSALVRSGFAESMINTIVFPRYKADGVTLKTYMGYENESDIFSILMRIASPDAPVPGTPVRAWLDHHGARVFRVRAPVGFDLDPFPLPPLRTPGNGLVEDGASFERLVESIKSAHQGLRTETRVAFPSSAANGDHCLDNLTQCNGDCRDTPYMAATFRLGAAPEAIIVAGRNHEKSGKASYVNVTATRVIGRTAFYSIVMEDLEGSAEVYLPGDPDAQNMWQVKFARHCFGEAYCYELTTEQIPINAPVAFMVRAYLDPSTETSAKVFPVEESELVFPRVIKIN